MREMYTLTTDQIDVSRRTIFLDKTKNGDKRQVPLSSVAIELIGSLSKDRLFPLLWNGAYEKSVLQSTTRRISIAFARAAEAAGCADLRFHDLRHEATCRLYERTPLSDLQIAKITGHRDLKMLRRYANLRASDLADKLW
jgi:integrase